MPAPDIAVQLHSAGLGVFPCAVHYDAVKHKWNKQPVTPHDPLTGKGESWQITATRTLDDPLVNWAGCTVIGVVIPDGVVVLDLDTYKEGCTLDQAAIDLGGVMPWADTLIQTTISKGTHYAYRSPDWPVRQVAGAGSAGLDTRTGGKGFICTGAGYEPNGFGLVRMAAPDLLPALPDHARPLLEHVTTANTPPPPPPEDQADVDAVVQALTHIDPGCSRSTWIKICQALRHQFAADEETGLALFAAWSRGEYSADGEPENYAEHRIDVDWHSTKPDGGTTIGSLFYEALQGGWVPPPSLDTAMAFAGSAPAPAPADTFRQLVDLITESGSDPTATDALVQAVRGMACTPLQRATLLALLARELKEADLLTKGVRLALDEAAGVTGPRRPDGPEAIFQAGTVVPVRAIPAIPLASPGTCHGSNAICLVREVFGGRVAVLTGGLRWWTGAAWARIDEETLTTLVFTALMPGKATITNVNGSKKALAALAPRLDPPDRCRQIFFRNGVLDVSGGVPMVHHDRANRNTGTLSVDYDPSATCPEFHAFITTLFGDTPDGHDRVALLQEVMGWALFKDDLNIQVVVAFDGASRGGKGVILDALADILGRDTCGTYSFADIGEGKTQSAFRDYDVMIDTEAKVPQRQNIPAAASFLNKVASNEPHSIPLLNTQTPWTGRFNTKVLLACNGVPTMIDSSGAGANRFVVLKFTRSFYGREDRGIAKRLAGELQGIAAWAVLGAQRIIANGGRFTVPATSTEAGEDLRSQSQPISVFMAECIVYDREGRTHGSDVWQAYRLWCSETNTRPPSRTQFYSTFNQAILGHPVERSRGVRSEGRVSTGYIGLTILPPETATGQAFAPTVVGGTES